MRLNLLNRTTIVGEALKQKPVPKLTARFGDVSRVDGSCFKASAVLDPATNILIQRVDLSEMFANVPLDISELEFNNPPGFDSVPEIVNVEDGFKEEPMLVEFAGITVNPKDKLGEMFSQWKRMVGLSGLPRSEVELSTLDDYLTVDARDAVIYCGLVRIKYK